MSKSNSYKGKIVWDEDADRRNLYFSVKNAGWEIQQISPPDKNCHLGDGFIADKYAKGRYPIFTGDKHKYEDDETTENVTSYIVHESVTPENTNIMQEAVYSFFSKHTATQVAGKKWLISEGRVEVKGLNYVQKKR